MLSKIEVLTLVDIFMGLNEAYNLNKPILSYFTENSFGDFDERYKNSISPKIRHITKPHGYGP